MAQAVRALIAQKIPRVDQLMAEADKHLSSGNSCTTEGGRMVLRTGAPPAQGGGGVLLVHEARTRKRGSPYPRLEGPRK